MVQLDAIRVAAVQALAATGDDEYRNVARAIAYAEEAAGLGARLVCFPEAFPGPATGPLDWGGRLDAPLDETMAATARRLGVYLACGGLEPVSGAADVFYVTQKLYAPDATTPWTYRRVQPDNPDLNGYFYAGRRHIQPGNELLVVPAGKTRVGLQVCGELFVPELSRVQMLNGADVLVAPINGRSGAVRLQGMWQTWHHIARARAAENLMYVVVAAKFLEGGPAGTVGLVAGPEATIARATRPGVLVADLDLARQRWLRNRYVDADLLKPLPAQPGESCATRCGQVRDRRPELYAALTAPQPGAFDFWYHRRGIRTESEEMQRAGSVPHTV